MFKLIVITMSADGLAPNGARPSAGIVMTNDEQVWVLRKCKTST